MKTEEEKGDFEMINKEDINMYSYEVIDKVLVLMLYRVGSHSDLFR